MRYIYVRERSIYTPDELVDKLKPETGSFQHWDAEECITSLLKRGVLATGAIVDDEDLSSIEYDKYQFRWVGIAVYQDLVVIVYPKYFQGERRPTISQMARILRVICKADAKSTSVGVMTDIGEREYDFFTLLITLFDMYDEYGEYTNYQSTIELNGAGSISWERTIEQCQPFLDETGPVYFDFKTIETNRNDSDYVTRLHRAILTDYSRELRESGLNELLSITPVELTEECVDDFGDPDIIDYQLERELNIQFVTWKRNLITLLRVIVRNWNFEYYRNDVSCLGTSHYQDIWELMCKVVFGNQLNTCIDHLGIVLTPAWAERGRETLLDIIPRPQWYSLGKSGDEIECGTVKTLRPDVVSILKYDNNLYLCIYDAKYYTPILDEKIAGVPGVESITKQYLYQQAYKSFVKDHDINCVVNAFFVPTSQLDGPHYLGRVTFPGIFPHQDKPFTNDIDMWALNADEMEELYLNDKQIDEAVLKTILCGIN